MAVTRQIPSIERLSPDPRNEPLLADPPPGPASGPSASVDDGTPLREADENRNVTPSTGAGEPPSNVVTEASNRLGPGVPGDTASRTRTVVPKSFAVVMIGPRFG